MSLESRWFSLGDKFEEGAFMRTLLVLAFTVFSVGAAPQQPVSVNPFAKSMADFAQRVDAYMKLRDEITKKIPEVKETGDPAKISGREKALGEAIAKARTNAKPLDIFGHDMVVHFKRILSADWKSRSPADRKALFNELPKGVTIGINQPYPTTLPLVSVPAKLLAELPMLPETLEYRLIDRHFLLRDRDANLVIDMLSGVLPQRDR
jgi:hypothetical protein